MTDVRTMDLAVMTPDDWVDLRLIDPDRWDKRLIEDLPDVNDIPLSNVATTAADCRDYAKSLLMWVDSIVRDPYRYDQLPAERLRLVVDQAQAWLHLADLYHAGV